MDSNEELRSLKRGLAVLALLNRIEDMTVTEVARRLRLPRTTAERVLMTLVAEGYVQRVPDEKYYRLTSKVCSLSRGFSEDCWIVQTATTLLFQVTEQIGWPLSIATPSGDSMTIRATTDRATTLWLSRRRVGTETPILNSSSGLVAYAFARPIEKRTMQKMLSQSKNAYNSERSEARALDLLVQPVRQNGFAFQPPPDNQPEHSIAVPIFSEDRYVASLQMSFMTRAMSCTGVIEDYAPLLRQLADRIGRASEARVQVELNEDFVPVLGLATRFGLS